MNQDRLPYISYMLRLWLENDQKISQVEREQSEWRASLEDPHTRELLLFEDIDALFDFLRDYIKQHPTDREFPVPG